MASFASPAERRLDPRTTRLASELGVSRHEAVGLLDDLYGWAAAHAPSGDLAPYPDGVLALAADWSGSPETFVTALLEAGILTVDATIADWHERFGRDLERRAAVARRSARRRAQHADPAGHPAGHPAGQGDSNEAGHPAGAADAPSPPDPPVPGATPTGSAPTSPSGTSGPPGDTGYSSAGEISGPAPGARAREDRAAPKPTPAQVRLGRIVDLVTGAGVEIYPSSRDGAAVRSCSAPADRIAEAYIAAARGEWDPGGDGWLGGNLSVHLVIGRLAGYRPRRGADFLETRHGRLVTRDPIDDPVAF